MKMGFSIAHRLYAIIGLSFCGLVGLAATQVNNLASSLHEQRQNELKHLAETALSIAREEHDATVRDNTSDDTARQKAANRIGALRYGSGDYFWINDLKPVMIMHPIKPELNGQSLSNIADPNGKRLFVEFAETVKARGSGFVDYQWPKPGKQAPQPKLSFVTGFEPWGWVIGTGVYIDDLQAQIWESARNVMLATATILLLIGTITLLLARRTSKALVTMTGALTKLGQGEFSIRLPGLERRDELGDMARSIEQFKTRAAEKAIYETERDEERRRLAEQAKAKAPAEMAESVEIATKSAVDQVAQGTDHMAENASSMTDSALTLQRNSASVAAAAEEALATAQTVANASSQLAASISQIASQASTSRTLTQEAVTASTQAQETISKLSAAATKVGTVTSLISEIASQTNLLALNATIEAARAGDAGRGFAVVASEVKSLAGQTAKATSEIAQQITEIQNATQASVTAIELIGKVIRNVDSVSSTISIAVEEQNSVTAEISRTVEETSHAAREVAVQIASVSAEATETGRRASEIRDGSALIAGKVDELRATLVRVIRTSTTDVDRRRSWRLDIHGPATLAFAGTTMQVRVRDVSMGGVLIDQAIPEADINMPVRLTIDGLAFALTGVIARKDLAATFVELQLDASEQSKFEKIFEARKAA